MTSIEKLKPISVWITELGITRKSMLRAIDLGHLQAIRLGVGPKAPYFLTQTQVQEWLASRTVKRRAW